MDVLLYYDLMVKGLLVLIEIIVLYCLFRHYRYYSIISKSSIVVLVVGVLFYTSSSVLSVLEEILIVEENKIHSLQLSLEMAGIIFLAIGFYRIIVELVTISNIDFLTNTYTKRYIDKLFHDEKRKCEKKKKVFSLIFIDIDNFKQINDRFGHEEGNRVLHEIASTLKSSVRKEDKVGRYGGDEFIILLHHTLYEEAEQILERCRKAISEKEEFKHYQIGVSGGVATYPYDGDSIQTLSDIADKRMYKDKEKHKEQWLFS